jgi:tRNA-splicing ligase RtcB
MIPLTQERAYIEQVNAVQYTVKMGFVPNMNVPGTFYVNDKLKDLLFEELAQSVQRGEVSKGGWGGGGRA